MKRQSISFFSIQSLFHRIIFICRAVVLLIRGTFPFLIIWWTPQLRFANNKHLIRKLTALLDLLGSLKDPAAPRLRTTGPKEFVAASKMHHIRSLLINRSIFVKPFKRLKTTTESRILFFFSYFLFCPDQGFSTSRIGFLQ